MTLTREIKSLKHTVIMAKMRVDKENIIVRDLIYYFTHNKGLTRQQQARRDVLIARDCVGMSNAGSINDGEPILPDSEQIRFIPPKQLHDFLFAFNQNEVLKYTCHEIDTQETIDYICEKCGVKTYSFKKHAKLISDSFDVLVSDFQRRKIWINKGFYSMLMAYIKGNERGWSSNHVKTSWNSEDILKWGDENVGIIPAPGKNIQRKQRNQGFHIPKAFISNLTGRRVLTFRELVIYFKSLFHIRRDNSLRSILEFQNKDLDKNGINIIYSQSNFRDNIELFTDVEKMVQAYKSIVRMCKEVHGETPFDIELSFYEEGDDILFTIHDKKSVYAKSLKNATERIGQQQHELIKNQINGLCELYVEADFGDNEYARINLWNKDSAPLNDPPNITPIKLDMAEGVKFILKYSNK